MKTVLFFLAVILAWAVVLLLLSRLVIHWYESKREFKRLPPPKSLPEADIRTGRHPGQPRK